MILSLFRRAPLQTSSGQCRNSSCRFAARGFLLVAMSLVALGVSGQTVPTAINFQGRASDNTPAQNPIDGTVNMVFEIWDAQSGGTRLWVEPAAGTIPIAVTKGIFNVILGRNGVPLPASIFTSGTSRYLQLTVGGQALTPRQTITSVGYADQCDTAATVTNGVLTTGSYSDPAWITSLAGSKISGTVASATTATNFSGSLAGDVTGTQGATSVVKIQGRVVASTAPSGGNVLSWNAGSTQWEPAAAASTGWGLTGNGSTTPGTNFLGTTDNVALQLHVNGARAFRLEPNATSPNVIAGYASNSALAGVVAATVAGGGNAAGANLITDSYGTIGGGDKNQAGDNAGTTADRNDATVGGGYSNTASGTLSTVGGGQLNLASGTAATVAGGNTNTASGTDATVPGGLSNIASGTYSFAAGRAATAAHSGAFVWADGTGVNFASTANNQFLIRAAGGVGLGTATPQNTLDVKGKAVIGATYSGTNAAPVNGLLVEGSVGLGTTTPQNKLDVEGSAAIGATYSGTNAAPANGLLVEGNVGVGTTTVTDPMTVNGVVRSTAGGFKFPDGTTQITAASNAYTDTQIQAHGHTGGTDAPKLNLIAAAMDNAVVVNQIDYKVMAYVVSVDSVANGGLFSVFQTTATANDICARVSSGSGVYLFPASTDLEFFVTAAVGSIVAQLTDFGFFNPVASAYQTAFDAATLGISSVVAGVFVIDQGTLWAANKNGGVVTRTDVTGGRTLTNLHNYRIHYTAAAVTYFVDGVLVATHTTNIPPSTTGAISFGTKTTTAAAKYLQVANNCVVINHSLP